MSDQGKKPGRKKSVAAGTEIHSGDLNLIEIQGRIMDLINSLVSMSATIKMLQIHEWVRKKDMKRFDGGQLGILSTISLAKNQAKMFFPAVDAKKICVLLDKLANTWTTIHEHQLAS